MERLGDRHARILFFDTSALVKERLISLFEVLHHGAISRAAEIEAKLLVIACIPFSRPSPGRCRQDCSLW